MAKILMSFVGTGRLLSNNKNWQSVLASARQYRTTRYHLGDEDLGEYPFVVAALTHHHAVDKVILIGTAHSMWEEVYRYFSEKNGMAVDDNVYFDLAQYCGEASEKSELVLPHKEEIEKVLGSGSQAMLIRYGLNDEEITENIGIVLGLNDLINTGDEIIVDVTHAFRSLPIFIMNLLLYLTNVSNKKPKISHIYYGMLEMLQTFAYAPIVDLKKILEINKWIVGASAFKNYGNAYHISELLSGVDSNLGNRLKRFSDLLNLNHLDKIEKEVEALKAIKNKKYDSMLSELTVKPVINDFLKDFGTIKDNHALFQYNLAKWQFKNMNYALSLISLSEAIITHACILEHKDWSDYDVRNEMKKSNNIKKSKLEKEMVNWYFRIREHRNSVAHSLKEYYSPNKIIDDLRSALNVAGKYIKCKPSTTF